MKYLLALFLVLGLLTSAEASSRVGSRLSNIRPNYSMSVDGNDYISITNTTNPGQGYSLSWCQKATNLTGERHPVGLSTAAQQIYQNNNSGVVNNTDAGGTLTSTVSDAVNEWACYALVSSASAKTLYRNGASVASRGTGGTAITTLSLALGARFNTASPWIGLIDEVATWNRTITPAEALELSKGNIVSSGAIGRYSFDNLAATDAVGTSNGVITGATFSPSVPHQFASRTDSRVSNRN